MKHVSLADVDRDALTDGVGRVRLSDHVATTDLALNHYCIAPGEGLPSGLHAHWDQEEVFLVVDGEATFETMDSHVSVGAGEAVRFAPKTFQSGWNAGVDPLVVLAAGAPAASHDIRIPFPCPDCEDEYMQLDSEDDLTFACPGCGAAYVPAPCPECGSHELQATLNDGGDPVVDCEDCGATFDSPPL